MNTPPDKKTPRTDESAVGFARVLVDHGTPENPKFETTELVPANFARQLERELAEALARERANSDLYQHERLSAIAPPQAFPDCLAEDFGDPLTLMNSRDWLQKAIEAKGAKVTGAGIGGGQADMDFRLEGCEFNVSLKPIIREAK
jgi:hypothetical protein